MTHKGYATCSAQNLNGETNSYYADDVNAYSLYIKDIKKSQRLSREEETELLKKASAGDIRAKGRVIESNLKLVISIAKKFSNKNNQLSDLIGEGNVGLLIAADKFDLDRKASFATYAKYRVLQNIVRAAYMQCGVVIKPAYVWERTRRVNKFANSFASQNGREPTVEEISPMVGVSLKSMKHLMEARKNCSIYNTYIDIENICDYEDGLQENPLDILVSKEEKTNAHIKVNQAMSGLSERERQIVVMRFGLNGDLPMTLQKVGRRLGLTRQRVQQLEKRIVGKLRDALSN
ncbi:MAG: sigma-70 family RNA polymerase sigma factor [Proteobacteria bacterium]|nr:sigma-70 family RNA polymerase sigma factor [Pseudomonadota bacterium]